MKMIAKLTTATLLSAVSLGCNVCEDLDERMCQDLGAEDCKLWKENEMNFAAQAKTRPRKFLQSLVFGADAGSCRAAGSDAAYPQILKATKDSLQHFHQDEAAQ